VNVTKDAGVEKRIWPRGGLAKLAASITATLSYSLNIIEIVQTIARDGTWNA